MFSGKRVSLGSGTFTADNTALKLAGQNGCVLRRLVMPTDAGPDAGNPDQRGFLSICRDIWATAPCRTTPN